MAGLTTGNGFPNVVVTGYAMTTALATDAEGTWKRLLDGRERHSYARRLLRRVVRPSRCASAVTSWRTSRAN